MKQIRFGKCVVVVLLIGFVAAGARAQSLWELAKDNEDVLRISTLFTAHNVRDHLGSEEGIDEAIAWCKATGVTRVFLETFRGSYTARRETLEHAKARFEEAGIGVSGCVTTTDVGKKSTGWKIIACYTDVPTQERIQEIFEYTASIFDEIMIDDFWFTDCECDACRKAKGPRSWAQYRCDLMTRISRDRVLKPARTVNSEVVVILKWPQWYDRFHERGYEVVEQTQDFDRIWVGTETRDYDDPRWGGHPQYMAYFIMRWLGGLGGEKTGGGWFDPYGTHEDTYVEQARQTVLADADEMLLFCYGSLQRDTGPANVARLRTEIPRLFELARLVDGKSLRGVAAPKPPNSDAHDEQYVYDFVGMLGLPLVPDHKVRTDVPAAFLPVQTLKDPQLKSKLDTMLDAGTPVLVTDGLADRLNLDADRENLLVLDVAGDPKRLLELTRDELRPIRDRLLAPLGLRFDAPNRVALYLIGDRCIVIENFNDEAISASLTLPRDVAPEKALILPTDGRAEFTRDGATIEFSGITPRTLVVLEY